MEFIIIAKSLQEKTEKNKIWYDGFLFNFVAQKL